MRQKRERVLVNIPEDQLKMIDEIAQGLGVSRSKFILTCVEFGLKDWRFLRKFMITPERLRTVAETLKKFGLLSRRDVEEIEEEIPGAAPPKGKKRKG